MQEKTLKETEDEIIDEFSLFDDWMSKYEYIIELGKHLPIIDAEPVSYTHLTLPTIYSV